HDQWGEIADGRVYGRGAADMKSGIVIYLAALDALRATGTRLNGDLLLAASSGEENGGLGALSTILRGYRADAVIVTEPTGLALVVAQGGSLVFRITVMGRSAHGATRNEGVSAFDKYLPIHQALLDWEAERNRTLSHPLYDHLENKFPISVGLVQAGNWASTVPETLVAEGRLGFLPGETIQEMQRQTEELVARVAKVDPWLREHPPVVEWFGGQFASAEVSPDEPIALAVGAAHRQVTGQDVRVEGIAAGTDVRLFTGIGGMPAVLYGGSELRTAHGPDEYAEIDDLVTAAETIAVTIADWCGTA
ncbi:MAG TPA: ArgE/DapE family deacylase, partial [Thermomicrobiales bacterium]|nr:ArgE/DapE family deacylase [Thermomicrobiales bacterium]